jgi:16S rRNA (cytosine967-C5)-methyltransferase
VAFRPADRDWAAGFEIFELTSHPPLESLGSFRQGMFYVQDPSTLLAPAVLAPPKDARVLDLCAAPGGKTTALASLLRGTGVVVAHDADPTRLGRLRENRARLGLDNVEVPAGAPEGIFDRVLVDAPCSNTGVLRRRVELRWRIRAEEISRLAALQSRLLADAARHVAPGGALVYSTCSVEPEENGAVADGFVREAPDFFEVARRELHPVRDGVDGAFVARFERRS